MKKYLFFLLISTNLSFCYTAQANPGVPDYQDTIVKAKKNFEKSPIALQFNPEIRKEVQILLDILLQNIQEATKTGNNINIIEQCEQTLSKRNTQLKEKFPAVFQKIQEANEANQWFQNCVFLIHTLVEKLPLEKDIVLKKIIKITRYTNKQSLLPSPIKQQREKVLTVFEEKLKKVGNNISVIEQGEETMTALYHQLTEEKTSESEKIINISTASSVFLSLADSIASSFTPK